MPVKNRIQLRRGTSTQWSNNVILASGELGWDTTVNNVKIGDGSNLWDDLPWLVVAGVSGQIINPAVISGVSGIFFDTSVGDVDQIAGQLGWNSEAGTFDVGLTDDLKISVGQSVLFRVKNSTGSTITKGEAVYASGVLGGGQIIQVAPFVADETIPEVRFIGLMLDDLADGEDGFVAEFGHIKNVDLRTTNTVLNPNAETWAVGDTLFVDDASAGGLTKVQPKNDIYVAMVLADGQNGELFVRITNPGHINDLHDVNTSGVVDNNLLVWNSGADYWEPTTSMTFDGTTLHLDTDGVSAKFGRDNGLTGGGKVRIYVDDGDTAGSNQAIKAFNNKSTGTNYGINATAYGSGTRNVALYGYAQRADQNWGLQVAAGISYFQDNIGVKNSNPVYELDVAGSGNFTGNLIVGGDLTVNGTTVIANVDTMEVEDPILTLGLASGNVVTDTNLDRGLALALNSNTTAFMGWDTSADSFTLLSSGVASNGSGNYAPGTYGDLHIGGLTATTANFSSTIDAANLGAGEDNSVVILDSDGKLRTDEIDSRVWGSSLVDGAGTANYISKWSDADTLTNSIIYDNGSNVGIGTTSPTNKLEVAGGNVLLFPADNTRQLSLYSSSYGLKASAGLEIFTGDMIRFRKGGTEYVRIDTSGNLGIGTGSPSYKLDTGLNSIVRVGRHILKSASFLNYNSTNIDNYIGTIDTNSNGDSASLEITVYNNSDSTWRKINLTLRNMGGTNTGFNYSVYGGGGNSKLFLKYVNRSGDASKTDLFLSNGTNTLSYTHFVTVSCPTATYSASFIEDTGYSATGATSVDLDANLALALTSTGSVGIGTASPSEKLDVSGNANITGHLSASTKSFLIDHPTKEGKKLQYGSLESPYHGVRLTGRDKLKEGVCVIKLPSYMKKLVREEDISIQITNYKHHKTLYVDDIDLAKNTFTVKGHRCKTLGELEFFWSFTAVRKDVPELIVEK